MFKKLATTALLVGALTVGNGAFAEEPVENPELEVEGEVVAEDVVSDEEGTENSETEVDPDNFTIATPLSNLYEAIRLIEEATIELTEGSAEKALLQIELADKRIAEAKVMIENGIVDAADELLEESENIADEAEAVIEEAEAAGEDLTDVKEVIGEMNAKRSENLLALLERENLPEQAKAGIRKALANQERAMERSNRNKEVVVEEETTVQTASQEEVTTEETRKINQAVEKANERAAEAKEKAAEQFNQAQEKAKKANKSVGNENSGQVKVNDKQAPPENRGNGRP